MKKQKQEESVHVAIAAYLRLQYPNVLFTSESSGIRVPMHLAVMMKKQRSTHKQPDMIILQPKGIYHGLILEIKKDRSEVFLKDGSMSKSKHIQEQNETLEILRKIGYCAEFACGFDHAKAIIDNYMSL
jgi:hypothetical protein